MSPNNSYVEGPTPPPGVAVFGDGASTEGITVK